jgi:hypothetical protein
LSDNERAVELYCRAILKRYLLRQITTKLTDIQTIATAKEVAQIFQVAQIFHDTSAFIILFGIFTAHVTGNIALAGSSFVSEDAETTITRLLMLPTFIITVALTSLLARYTRR